MKQLTGLIVLSTTVLFSSMAVAGGSSLFADRSGHGASTSSFYGGASVGKSYMDNCSIPDSSDNDYASTCEHGADSEDDEMAWKIFGGYKFTPNFGVEGAYTDMGTYSSTTKTSRTAIYHADATAFSVAGIASAPVADNFELFGKLGMARWERESQKDTSDSNTTIDEGTDLLIGAGAQFNVTENIGIRGEVEHYDDLDVNIVTIGGTFSSY